MQCRHDEALLRAGQESLARVEAEVGEAKAAQRRADDVEWEGAAGDSFRARTAFIAAELTAVTLGITALGCLLASVQGELRACEASRSSSATAPDGLATSAHHLPVTSVQGPLLPIAPSGPLLPQVARAPLLPYHSSFPAPPMTGGAGGQELCR
ncbi:hypothetical protein [Sinomonas humi]|uniref:Uncharacterized protein n=1 Tax=Sinomonas humi TaxID=1338436 RepID=A0A0B2AD23_9MICC|nr:hypothetical protein [Sinomonas humi]KHL01464.1 hypothetical protein LK10_16605 [Sinomonas humi]